jgi:NADPH-dependent curcumin reductase CurA
MNQNKQVNRQILLASRPFGAPSQDNFTLAQTAKPSPQQGEILLRTVYLSLDPYMRGRMNDAKSYADPVALNEVMVGGSVCRVEESMHADYQPGDWVVAFGGWQDYSISNGIDLLKLGNDISNPSYALGVLGMPGLTAYMGLLDIGQPKAGETVVVAAATGAVGSLVGQIAKIQGCKVIGIAGGAQKCQYAVDTLGFDACLDHHSDELAALLAKTCTDGIDVYFENVGGKVFDAVLPLLNPKSRIPVCGLISQYNATELPIFVENNFFLKRLFIYKFNNHSRSLYVSAETTIFLTTLVFEKSFLRCGRRLPDNSASVRNLPSEIL